MKFMSAIKSAIVTGVTGQDGSWMVEYLLKNTNLNVYGAVRRTSKRDLSNIEHIQDKRFSIIDLDIADSVSVSGVVEEVQPDFFINFAANSFVGSSWGMPVNCFQTNTMSVLYILDAIRRIKPTCRFYNAGSSEEWGNVDFTPQDETHPLKPRSPYGASKCAARHLVKVYRESYGIYAVQGWLFNHEGTRRGIEFVTRKISKKVAEIAGALQRGEDFAPLELGNLDAKRDWGDAEDFVDAVWRMLNQEVYGPPETKDVPFDVLVKQLKEYVVATNETHSIREFVEAAFDAAGIAGYWGFSSNDPFSPLNEIYGNKETGKILMKVNPEFYRPAEVDILKGDSSKIREELGWEPKTSFEQLVKKMVTHDLNNG